uniref:Nose resistant-to-fluoxetine protein N-terminal domain-containing protein n=1 Tax=Panagrolaimus sp. ES5 TaxID=591445 RepID=A0AC34GUI2_9BILA
MRLIFLLSWFTLIFAAKKDAFHYSLSENELRDIISDTEFDSEEAEEYGKQIHSFFHESNSQLILDLDLFTQFWKELDEARASAVDGNIDYIKEIITFLKPLQKYDISAPCLADVFHFLWTTYNYAVGKLLLSLSTLFLFVVDAIGKLPAAVTGGNNLWVGSWQTCRKITTIKNIQGQSWNGQYCLARFYVHNKNSPLKFGEKFDPAEVCRSQSQSYEDWLPEDKACFDIMPLLNVG